jgi:hypothetical protein
MRAYLRLVGETPEPTFTTQLQHLADQLHDVTAGDPPVELDLGTLVPDSSVQLGFYPWVPLLPGRLRARLTAACAVERVTEFLDHRLGVDGWPGGGCEVRTRVRQDRVEVTLVNHTTWRSLPLPSMPLAPFLRDRGL